MDTLSIFLLILAGLGILFAGILICTGIFNVICWIIECIQEQQEASELIEVIDIETGSGPESKRETIDFADIEQLQPKTVRRIDRKTYLRTLPYEELKAEIKAHPQYLRHLEDYTQEIALVAIREDASIAKWPKHRNGDYNFKNEMVRVNPLVLLDGYIDDHESYWVIIMQVDGLLLQRCPQWKQKMEICSAAVQQNKDALQFVVRPDWKAELKKRFCSSESLPANSVSVGIGVSSSSY